MKAGLTGHKASSAAASAPNGAGANGSDRRQAQGIAQREAELILTVLRELKKGNFAVRMPITPNAAMRKIAAELNGIIELNERNAKNLSGVARVIGAVAEGDLSQTMELELDGRPLEGQFLRTARTVNAMVGQLRSFTSEVTRVAGEVGTEGKLGGQAQVKGAAGVWKDLTDNVNLMAANLTAQVRNIADVTTAVAKGDLSKKITVDVRGEILELKNTINVMVDQLKAFASEVTRVAREVGTEGKLGGQAQVRGIGGVWKDLTDNVNFMAMNLTAQVRNIADVTTAVAKGDLSKKITVYVQGEILELKNTINVMVDQLNAFAREVTRVAREVGTEGNLGGQAQVEGVAGVWKDLTDNVNYMAGNLTAQVRNIAEVTTAVAQGDLSKKITVDVRGEILQLKNTINSMVDQLNGFAGEVTRVAREVGTEGRLGGQASVPGASGTWKDLTQQVNQLAANLTTQVRNIAEVTTAVQKGDLSKKITVEVRGEILELKDTINVMVDQLNAFASEVTRVAREVGTEGRLGGQAHVPGASGTWRDLTDNVNSMAGNLTAQVRNIADVTTAVARGDLSKKITVDVQGEIRELKDTINVMVDQLNAFASEVTRVAREVGTEGKLGGQAQVKGVAGTWKDLTDSVNLMAGNLTDQVRGIARVVTAVADGDLRRKVVFEAKGEIAALADTINEMTDTLAVFAAQVTTVARKVGVEGELGGQASVPGAAGTWKDLTDNVNQLAANLTNQVRAIAEVTTAVTEGDLTRSIVGVEARGEVALLRDKINEMISNLRETTQKNTEQDWLKTNIAKHTRMLQGQRDLRTVADLILTEVAPLVSAQYGAFYVVENRDGHEPVLRMTAGYALGANETAGKAFRWGEGLVGQCARDSRRILLTTVPAGYIGIRSGLGEAPPNSIVVLPVLFEGRVKAVVELASVQPFSATHLDFLDQLTDGIGVVVNTIEANMRTEELLKQSQILFAEAQEASKSKSAFLSMAAHELRTPLSVITGYLSMLQDGSIPPSKAEQPLRVLMGKATELNSIVDDLLTAARIEGGTVPTDAKTLDLREMARQAIGRAEARAGLLRAEILYGEPDQPVAVTADREQLARIIDNLINNALTYSAGWPWVKLSVATEGGGPSLTIEDRGVGIARDKQDKIFERFFRIDDPGLGPQPGTGLGLFISRELAERHGGSLTLEFSEIGKGSTFVLRLPATSGTHAATLISSTPTLEGVTAS